VSALYHRKHWQPAARAKMKRLDHANIFLFIAGSYTPITVVGVGGSYGKILCVVLWIGALLGIGQTVFWPQAPRWLHVGIYVVLGWTGALGLPMETAQPRTPRPSRFTSLAALSIPWVR
jgi:hemolysin III